MKAKTRWSFRSGGPGTSSFSDTTRAYMSHFGAYSRLKPVEEQALGKAIFRGKRRASRLLWQHPVTLLAGAALITEKLSPRQTTHAHEFREWVLFGPLYSKDYSNITLNQIRQEAMLLTRAVQDLVNLPDQPRVLPFSFFLSTTPAPGAGLHFPDFLAKGPLRQGLADFWRTGHNWRVSVKASTLLLDRLREWEASDYAERVQTLWEWTLTLKVDVPAQWLEDLAEHSLSSWLRAWEMNQEALLEARNAMVEGNLRLVPAFLSSQMKAVPTDMMEELVGAGNVGLVRAADEWDYRRGTAFITLAYYWILMEIRRFMKHSHLIRLPPDLKQVLEQIGILSLDAPQGPDHDLVMSDIIADGGEDPFEMTVQHEETDRFSRWYEQLRQLFTPGEQVIFTLLFETGQSLRNQQLAELSGLTENEVVRLKSDVQAHLRSEQVRLLVNALAQGEEVSATTHPACWSPARIKAAQPQVNRRATVKARIS